MARERYHPAFDRHGRDRGVYYPYGGGMANVLSNNLENTEVTAEVPAASVDNMKLIESKDADLALALGDTVFDASQGQGPVEEPIPVRALATLYYNSIFLMIELDARRLRSSAVRVETPPLRRLVFRYGYHFTSLIAIMALMLVEFTPIATVFYATILAFVLSFLDREHALTPARASAAGCSGR